MHYADTCSIYFDIRKVRSLSINCGSLKVWLDDLVADLRHAARGIARTPAYAATVILVLAVGIGATVGLVSILNAIVIRSLPYRDPASVAVVLERTEQGNGRTPSYSAYKDYLGAVGGSVASISFMHGGSASYRASDGLERVSAWWVTPTFFPLLGTAPRYGRTFTADDERPGAGAVAVIGYQFWRRQFGGDPGVVGRTIDVDSIPTTIIGVMPTGFDYPLGTQLWLPISLVESRPGPLQSREVHVDSRTLIRMRTPHDSAAAAIKLNITASRLAREYPASSADWTSVQFWPIRSETIGTIARTLYTLAGAAGLVLILACANVATLALIRGSVQARELAVRVALGATRARIARQLLVEAAVICAGGGIGGMVIALAIVRFVRFAMGLRLPRSDELVIDGSTLAIGAAALVVATTLVSIAPTVRTSRRAIAERLYGWNAGSVAGRADSLVRAGLVTAQITLAVTLLLSAGLLLQSFRRLYATPDEYDTQRIASAAIFPPSPAYDTPHQAAALYARLIDAVKRIPGIEDAAVVNHVGGRIPTRLEIPGSDASEIANRGPVFYLTASSEYAHVMGFHMVRGRWFDAADMRAPDASGFVVNETMAKRYFPGMNPVGRIITAHRASQARPDIGQPISGPIIGVVGDVHWFGRDNEVYAEVYVPYTREVWPWITLVARAKSPAVVAPAIRRAVFGVEPNIPLSSDNGYSGVQIPTRGGFDERELVLSTIGAFAVSALLLAAIGLYGVVAYGVEQRTREFGVRMALGATRANIGRLVFGGVAALIAVGLIAGIAGGLAATRLIHSMLFHTAPTDAATLVLVPVTLVVVALGAAWRPVRRATRLDPAIPLKAE